MVYPPKLIRLKEAPWYLGMDKNRFKAEVRPWLTEIPIGSQGIAFDRLDLDAWADQYKAAKGRPGKQKGEKEPWRKKEKELRVSSSGKMVSGTSTKWSEEEEFAKALEQVMRKKPRHT